MTAGADQEQPNLPSAGVPGEDVTGGDRMVRNVVTSWLAHFLFVIGGFLMPRLIDRRLGQQPLGVWDFCWALVSYFSMIRVGIVSSVNRYVARFRATGDAEGVNRAVTSVSCVLAGMGVVVLAMGVAATFLIPLYFRSQLGDLLRQAQWVVLLLGINMAVEVAFSGFGGVLTGCHRWTLHNATDAGAYAVSLLGMLAALLLGGGLRWLALVTLCASSSGWAVRFVLAHRVCPELHLRLRHARWSTAREMFTFGGKTFIPHVGELVLNQTAAVLIMVYLGPAVVAVFARSRSLVKHVRLLIQKFALVLTPTASSLFALGRRRELQDLLISATRSGLYIALPLIGSMVILGGSLLRVWMGPRYEAARLLAALAVGHLALVSLLPAVSILRGMNAHGRPGVANLIASVPAIGLIVLALGPLRWGLVGVAFAICLPLTLVNGLYVPIYACRRLGVSVKRFILEVAPGPVLCVLPYSACLVAARIAFAGRPLAALASGLTTGGLVLGLLYWRYALPLSLKAKLAKPFQNLAFLGRTGT